VDEVEKRQLTPEQYLVRRLVPAYIYIDWSVRLLDSPDECVIYSWVLAEGRSEGPWVCWKTKASNDDHIPWDERNTQERVEMLDCQNIEEVFDIMRTLQEPADQ
jgi:hypothetical protein